MLLIDPQSIDSLTTPERKAYALARIAGAVLSVFTLALLNASAAPAAPASLMRSVDVEGTADAVWSAIGSFCAIKDWHPAIGACTEDGKTPPTRTLVTKDGKATFIELETARNNAEHSYSYTFKSAPAPVTHYSSTFRVAAKGPHTTTITWSGAYIPDPGKEKDAMDMLSGIYQSGLDEIKARLAL